MVFIVVVLNNTPSVLSLTFQFCKSSLARLPLVVLSRIAMVGEAAVSDYGWLPCPERGGEHWFLFYEQEPYKLLH